MAKIKRTMTVSLEEFGKRAGEYALDEFEYNGLTIRQWADKITSGEYQLVKHGHWEYRGRDTDGRLIYKCSECGYTLSVAPEMNLAMSHEKFCYNCGAKMDLKENDDA